MAQVKPAAAVQPAADTPSSRDDHDTLLPVRLWGLDPCFWSCIKLFARDVLALSVHPSLPDCLLLCCPMASAAGPAAAAAVATRVVSKVEVMGVVVGVKHNRDKGVEYLIDDGTGVLSCLCWYVATAAAAASASALGSGLLSSSALYRDLPTVSTAFVSTPFHTLSLGAVARVRGRLSCWREQRQVNVESLYVEVDPNAETMHWLECMQLRKTLYQQPSRIAVESALLTRSARLADAIKSWLQESKLRSFNEHSLLQQHALKQLADAQVDEEVAARSPSPDSSAPSAAAPSSTAASCVRAALDYLLQMGLILKTAANAAGEAQYELTSMERHLAPLVFSIIAGASAGSGVHRDTIIQTVHARYSNVLVDDIQRAIATLEKHSDISLWDTPLSYVSCNPAAAAGVEPLQMQRQAKRG